MSRDGVIVKHLPAIQNFGSIDILCSDKTGTLTSGEMRLHQAMDALGAASDRTLMLAYVNSRFETGIRSPLDLAILGHGDRDVSAYTKVDELPFDFERRRVSIVVKPADAGTRGSLLVTKGAPEPILALSTAVEVAGEPRPIDATTRAACLALYNTMSADGLRVIAVAYRWLPDRTGVFAGRRDRSRLRRLPELCRSCAVGRQRDHRAARTRRSDHQDSDRRQRPRGQPRVPNRETCGEADCHRRRDRPARRWCARTCGGGSRRVRARLAVAEESHHSGAQAARARGGISRRRHQRRAVSARGGCRDFGRRGHRRGARGSRHHSWTPQPAPCCTAASSKAAGHRAT